MVMAQSIVGILRASSFGGLISVEVHGNKIAEDETENKYSRLANS